MSHNLSPIKASQMSIRSYVIGFIASLVFTLSAYLLVVHHVFSATLLMAVIITLALAQFLTQMIFFLHLGLETKPRWKLLVFGFMVLVVAILVFGSLWIMYHLNYHMTLQQMYKYLNSQGDGI